MLTLVATPPNLAYAPGSPNGTQATLAALGSPAAATLGSPGVAATLGSPVAQPPTKKPKTEHV